MLLQGLGFVVLGLTWAYYFRVQGSRVHVPYFFQEWEKLFILSTVYGYLHCERAAGSANIINHYQYAAGVFRTSQSVLLLLGLDMTVCQKFHLPDHV